jgi:hypothetical protein
MEKLEENNKKLQERKITFKKNPEGYVSVYGVAPEPLVAHCREWLRFFAEGHAPRLREFVTVAAQEKK